MKQQVSPLTATLTMKVWDWNEVLNEEKATQVRNPDPPGKKKMSSFGTLPMCLLQVERPLEEVMSRTYYDTQGSQTPGYLWNARTNW